MAFLIRGTSQIENGARLRVWRRDLGFWHVGIAAWLEGFLWVIHNQKGRGVIWSTYTDFAQGAAVVTLDRPSLDEGTARVNRAVQYLGRGYDLVLFNCEHFVNLVCAGTATSPQLQGAMGLIAAGGLMLWALASAA